jgi:hypothetical protein
MCKDLIKVLGDKFVHRRRPQATQKGEYVRGRHRGKEIGEISEWEVLDCYCGD